MPPQAVSLIAGAIVLFCISMLVYAVLMWILSFFGTAVDAVPTPVGMLVP